LIVDAHAHAFPAIRGMIGRGPVRGAGFGRVSFGGEMMQLVPPAFEGTSFTVETLIANMDWAGVDRAVLLQGSFYGEENDYIADACAAHPGRLCGMAFVDPWAPGARAAFDAQAARGVFRGLKLECTESTGLLGLHPGARLDDAALSWLWKELEAMRWVLVLDLGSPGSASYQTGAVRGIATACPGLRIVIAHLGQPGPGRETTVETEPARRELWTEQISLGRLPNVWFDMAALPAYRAGDLYPWPGAASHLRRAVDLVGARRILWGTDAPGLLTVGTYPQLRRWAEDALGALSAQERRAVFGENAREVFSLQ